jgi:hypothetical protein
MRSISLLYLRTGQQLLKDDEASQWCKDNGDSRENTAVIADVAMSDLLIINAQFLRKLKAAIAYRHSNIEQYILAVIVRQYHDQAFPCMKICVRFQKVVKTTISEELLEEFEDWNIPLTP